MSYATLNGAPVLEAVVRLPRGGTWTAEVSVDVRQAPEGSVSLVLGGGSVTLQGTARRSASFRDTVRLHVVGGAGRLSSIVEPKAYWQAPVSIPLGDLLAASGERLAADVDPALRGRMLDRWTRLQGTVAASLMRLLGAVGPGLVWRVRGDGALWLGQETWPTIAPAHELLHDWPEDDRIEVWTEAPVLAPGTTFRGRRVSVVEHSLSPTRIRTQVWFER